MLKGVFKLYGFTIEESKPFAIPYYIYTIYHSLENIKTQFKWDANFDLESILKGKEVKLIATLINGAQFESIIYDANRINAFIDAHFINLTPEEKLDSVLEYVNQLTSFDGQNIELKKPYGIEIPKMYFNHVQEWEYYLESAISLNYIRVYTLFNGEYTESNHNLTVSGLTKLIQINERKTSRFCFVAMAFTSEMEVVYQQAIEPAIKNCGFEPYIVNKVNVESDKTINDAILAGIKKARFTIADFTYHRGGVYFEAGYALGRGQNVIYTCREDEMGKAHFDIRNYQHIVWSDVNDLKVKLINKIEAFIKD